MDKKITTYITSIITFVLTSRINYVLYVYPYIQVVNTKARRKVIMKKKIVNTDRKMYSVSSL